MWSQVLAHRLGLVPIFADPNDFQYKAADKDYDDKNSILFKLRLELADVPASVDFLIDLWCSVKCTRNPDAPDDAPVPVPGHWVNFAGLQTKANGKPDMRIRGTKAAIIAAWLEHGGEDAADHRQFLALCGLTLQQMHRWVQANQQQQEAGVQSQIAADAELAQRLQNLELGI